MNWPTALRSVFFRVLGGYIGCIVILTIPVIVYANLVAIRAIILQINFWANVTVGMVALFINIWILTAASTVSVETVSDTVQSKVRWVSGGTMLVYLLSLLITLTNCVHSAKIGVYEVVASAIMVAALFVRVELAKSARGAGA